MAKKESATAKKQARANKASALIMALTMSISCAAPAAQLGRLVTYSNLSEPLSAAVVVEDVEGLDLTTVAARIASAETYAKMGIKRPDWLDRATVSVQMIDKGRAEVRITTAEPVETPAAALIVEWQALDPSAGPTMRRQYALLLDPAAAVSAPVADRKAVAAKPAAGEIPPEPMPVKPVEMKKEEALAKPESKPAPKMSAGADGLRVRRGQTLSEIAGAYGEPGATVDQTMMGFLRLNPHAFEEGNINRLKTGVILKVPTEAEALQMEGAKARAEVAAQAKAFREWRKMAAAGAEKSLPASSRSVSGQVTQQEQAAQEDKLRLGEPQGKEGAKLSSKVDKVATAKASEDQKERVRELESMKKELSGALKIESDKLAQAGKESKPADGEGKPAEVKEAPSASKEAAGAESAEQAKPAEPAASAPQATASAPQAAASAPAKPAAKPPVRKPVVVPQEPMPEPNILMDFAPQIGAALAALLGLGGFFAWRRRKAKKEGMKAVTIEPTTQTVEGLATQELAAGEEAVAERSEFEERMRAADTYLAFGQLEKAREEVQAALSAQPGNPAALVKLMRVESQSLDFDAFEKAFSEIADQTLKSGAHWDEAEKLAEQFYSQHGQARMNDKPMNESAMNDLDSELAASLEQMSAMAPELPEGPSQAMMDFTVSAPKEEASIPDFGLSFDTQPMELTPSKPAPAPAPAAGAPMEFESLSFDLSLPDDSGAKASEPAAGGLESLNFEMSAPAAVASEEGSDMKTMLDLAKAYVEMGDKEGAKELLEEIAAKDATAVGVEAKKILATLG